MIFRLILITLFSLSMIDLHGMADEGGLHLLARAAASRERLFEESDLSSPALDDIPIQGRLKLLLDAAAASTDEESSEESDSHSRGLFNMRSMRLVEEIEATRSGGDIRFESPFFSDRDVINALCRAAQRGVTVAVHISSRSGANVKKLQEAGVRVRVIDDLHAKRCMISHMKRKRDDSLENAGIGAAPAAETTVFVGSDNVSYLSRSHAEMMVQTDNDPEYYAANRALFMTPDGKKPRSRITIGVTPKKRKVVGSREHMMNASKALRLMKLAESRSSGDSVDIASMTFDNTDIVEAIERIYAMRTADRPRIRFILDRTALRHRELLDRIKGAGGSDVSIYIYNEDAARKIFQRYPQIQHSKTITRACGDDRLVIASTGNLTDHSDLDFNVDSYHPGDVRLFDAIRSYNNELIAECTEYTG